MNITFVDDAKRSWRWASVRLGWVAGGIAGYLALYPDELKGLIAYVPEGWRPLAALLVAMLVSGLPWLARVLKKVPTNA